MESLFFDALEKILDGEETYDSYLASLRRNKKAYTLADCFTLVVMKTHEAARIKETRMGFHNNHLNTLKVLADITFNSFKAYGIKGFTVCTEILYDLFQVFIQKASTKQFRNHFLDKKYVSLFEAIRILDIYTEMSGDVTYRNADNLKRYILENVPPNVLNEANVKTSGDFKLFAKQYVQLSRLAVVILAYGPSDLAFNTFDGLIEVLSKFDITFPNYMVEYVFLNQLNFVCPNSSGARSADTIGQISMEVRGIFSLSAQCALPEDQYVVKTYLEDPFINLSNYKEKKKLENSSIKGITNQGALDIIDYEFHLLKRIEVSIDSLEEFMSFLVDNIVKVVSWRFRVITRGLTLRRICQQGRH